MWKKVGIVRTRKGLREALIQIKKWEKRLSGIKEKNIGLLELKNMLLTARLIIQSALKRKKSLGSHWIINELFTSQDSS